METNARYLTIGGFTLAVIVAIFAFVFWLNRAGGLAQRDTYQVRFENSVSGLQPGAAVLFDGLRVGEVSRLNLDPQNPKAILASIAVATGTPLRRDTKVGIEFQGLMGTAAVTLEGGSASAEPLTGEPDSPPTLTADPDAGRSLTQTAREALQHVDTVVTDNSENLKSTIANLRTFSDALARNSGRLDSVMAGLEKMAGGGPAKPQPLLFDLATPAVTPLPASSTRPSIVIAEPTAAGYLQTQRLLGRSQDGQISQLGDVQWADLLPKLVQGKLLQTFENAGMPATLAEPLGGSTGERQLKVDLRSFEISASGSPVADVAFSAKIIGPEGRLIGTKVFHASVPCASTDAPVAVAALDAAFGKVATELLTWASETV